MSKFINFLKSFFDNPSENQFALGAFPNDPDNRDIAYSSVVGNVKISGSQITVPRFFETQRLEQGNLGTCVEHAFEFIKRVDDNILHSRRIPYIITRDELGWTESSGQGLPQREAAKVASIVGTPKDAGLDNNELSHALYTSLKITQAMRDEANIYRFKGFTFPTISEEGIKQALQNGDLVTITIPIDWNKIDADGTIHLAENIAGYHQVVIGQSDNLTGKFRFANWWGQNWGTNGDGFIQYNELKDIIIDAIVFREIPEDLILRAKQTPYLFTKDLFFGMESDAVIQLQKRLALSALFHTQYSRRFGLKTLQAVKDFQRIKGIKDDGKVGPRTRELLNN